MLYGSTSRNPMSQFVKDIPTSLCEETRAGRSFGTSFGTSYGAKPQRDGFDYSNVLYKAPEKKANTPMDVSGIKYTSGMKVEHKTFGKGFILKVTPMGADSMLEIAFESVGTKKIMAGYARLTILS